MRHNPQTFKSNPPTEMDANKFFNLQLFYLKFDGILLAYENSRRGFVQKFWSYVCFLSLIVVIMGGAHFVANNIDENLRFMGVIAPLGSSIYMFTKIFSFSVQRKRIKKLLDTLKEMSESGMILNCLKFAVNVTCFKF